MSFLESIWTLQWNSNNVQVNKDWERWSHCEIKIIFLLLIDRSEKWFPLSNIETKKGFPNKIDFLISQDLECLIINPDNCCLNCHVVKLII